MEIFTLKRGGRQTLLIAQVNVQNIREMDTKGVDSQKVRVPAFNAPKLCLRVDSFPNFYVLNTGSYVL